MKIGAMSEFIERRKYPRIDQSYTIEFALAKSSENPTNSENISACGVSFASETEMAPDTVIKMHLKESLEGHSDLFGLSPLAKVVRCDAGENGFVVAAQFINLPKRTEELLETYLYTDD